MASEAIKKIGIQNEDGTYSYTDIGADANKISIDDTTLDKKLENIEETILDKVDKVEGKDLSTNDYTDEDKNKVDNAIQLSDIDAELNDISENPVQNKIINEALNSKVDKIEGKSLSTNDYTDEDKAKVASIGTGGGSGSVGSLTDLGITATAEELNAMSGIQGSVQTQLDGKAPMNHASESDKYGMGTYNKWGHVKVCEAYSEPLSDYPYSDQEHVVNQKGINDLYKNLSEKIRDIQNIVLSQDDHFTLSYVIDAYDFQDIDDITLTSGNYYPIKTSFLDDKVPPGIVKGPEYGSYVGALIGSGNHTYNSPYVYYCKSQSNDSTNLLYLAQLRNAVFSVQADLAMTVFTGSIAQSSNILSNNSMITKDEDLADCSYFEWKPMHATSYVLNNEFGKLYLYTPGG